MHLTAQTETCAGRIIVVLIKARKAAAVWFSEQVHCQPHMSPFMLSRMALKANFLEKPSCCPLGHLIVINWGSHLYRMSISSQELRCQGFAFYSFFSLFFTFAPHYIMVMVMVMSFARIVCHQNTKKWINFIYSLQFFRGCRRSENPTQWRSSQTASSSPPTVNLLDCNRIYSGVCFHRDHDSDGDFSWWRW